MGSQNGVVLSVVRGCNGFDVFISNGVDEASLEYFDSATDKLVALANTDSNGQVRCFAGPPDFVVPKCSTAQVDHPCSDAGAVE